MKNMQSVSMAMTDFLLWIFVAHADSELSMADVNSEEPSLLCHQKQKMPEN